MNGKQMIDQTYAVGYNSPEIDADKAAFASYIDAILPKVADIKAKGASRTDAYVAFDQVIRGWFRKTMGGNEKSYMLDGRMMTVNTSTLNRICDLMHAEIDKAY